LNRSKKKEQKRREEYNKAVKHKMESAADLADKYSRQYELSPNEKNSAYKRNARIVNRKLLLILGGVLLQTLILFFVAILVSLPMKNSFKDVLENYFGTSKPQFASYELSDEFIGSDNKTESVYYTDVEIPDINCFYATVSGEKFSDRVYYGVSEQSLLSGVGHVSSTSFPGFGKPIMLYGYSHTYFSGVEALSAGDVLTYTTNYGVYEYQVTSSSVITAHSVLPYDLEAEKEQLIICTDYPFDKYKTETGKTYCIIADKVSGPEVVY